MPNKNAHFGVVPGAEVFLEKHLDLVKGKKVGLLTNPTGVDRNLNSLIDLFFKHPEIDLAALFGPEHGLQGRAQAGEYVPLSKNKKYSLSVYSLYGQDLKFESGLVPDLDKTMRTFDIQSRGKIPEQAMLKELDVMVLDLQDVGTRVYTYAATMAYCMQVCGENGIDFIILDRPNPLNGIDMEGPILEYPEFSSFVGLYPIPLRHAMTLGELALFIQDNFLQRKSNLKVIPMKGWHREMWFDDTALPWVPPSPNMPTLNTAMVYPGQVLLEGTNVSEGRGTSRPFEVFGAPWIDGKTLCRLLSELGLKGVKFQETDFTPSFSKYRGQLCSGCQVHVIERDIYKPLSTALFILSTVLDLYAGRFEFHKEYFDKVMGTDKVRAGLEQEKNAKEILMPFEADLRQFSEERYPYLLYD